MTRLWAIVIKELRQLRRGVHVVVDAVPPELLEVRPALQGKRELQPSGAQAAKGLLRNHGAPALILVKHRIHQIASIVKVQSGVLIRFELGNRLFIAIGGFVGNKIAAHQLRIIWNKRQFL